ncbi:hypothetical protein J6590_024878 [Homalodisca vitripennis]|nr:hypothetical protein J6590_024878 [Homalodisca vitripennis]
MPKTCSVLRARPVPLMDIFMLAHSWTSIVVADDGTGCDDCDDPHCSVSSRLHLSQDDDQGLIYCTPVVRDLPIINWPGMMVIVGTCSHEYTSTIYRV